MKHTVYQIKDGNIIKTWKGVYSISKKLGLPIENIFYSIDTGQQFRGYQFTLKYQNIPQTNKKITFENKGISKLAHILNIHCISQDEISEHTGIHKAVVSAFINNKRKNPTIQTINKFRSAIYEIALVKYSIEELF